MVWSAGWLVANLADTQVNARHRKLSGRAFGVLGNFFAGFVNFRRYLKSLRLEGESLGCERDLERIDCSPKFSAKTLVISD